MIRSIKKFTFAALATVGLAGSLAVLLRFVTHPVYAEQGFLACLVDLTRNHPVAAAITLDAVVAGFAVLIWMIPEARRLAMRWWLYVILFFTTPLAFVVPLFLFMRELRLEQLAGLREHLSKPIRL